MRRAFLFVAGYRGRIDSLRGTIGGDFHGYRHHDDGHVDVRPYLHRGPAAVAGHGGGQRLYRPPAGSQRRAVGAAVAGSGGQLFLLYLCRLRGDPGRVETARRAPGAALPALHLNTRQDRPPERPERRASDAWRNTISTCSPSAPVRAVWPARAAPRLMALASPSARTAAGAAPASYAAACRRSSWSMARISPMICRTRRAMAGASRARRSIGRA